MKPHNIPTAFVIIVTLGLLPLVSFAQSARSSYFMKTSYTRTDLNAALRPDQAYIGVPFLSNVYFQANTNTFNLDNLTFPMDGERVTFMHPQITNERALENISINNYIVSDIAYDVFSMGFFQKESYWNIHLGVRANADINVPKSLFELLKVGFHETKTVTHDLSDISMDQNTFIEIGVGNSRTFMNKSLTLGARAKLLAGISRLDLDVKSLNLTAGNEYWRARSQVSFKAAGPGIRAKYVQNEYDTDKQDFDGFDYHGFNIPGYGLGLDIGGVYDFKDVSFQPLKKLRISYALNDIGFIKWSKDNFIQLTSPDTEVVITPNDYSIGSDGNTSINDIFDQALDDIKGAINLYEKPVKESSTTALRLNMNMGLEYEIWLKKMTLGLLYSKRYGSYFNTHEFTASTNYTPKPWFATSLSYSFVHSAYNTLGLAVHLAPSKGINFFLASDYSIVHISPEWMPTTSKAFNIQLGVSIPMGGKRP